MRLILNRGVTDPGMNLAIEEHCLRNLDMRRVYLLLYVNNPSVIIGRNQNPLREIDGAFARDKGIQIFRRVSGGGAVYHDPGNLNFSFITRHDRNHFHNFRHFTGPVISALNRMGVSAELNGRNDIVVRGRKISGNAQYSTGKTMLSHGTLLLNSDLDALNRALRGSAEEIRSKALPSVRSRVANISDFLSEPMSMGVFRSRLLESLFKSQGTVREYALSDDDWMRAEKMAREKYRSWDWTYGRSPKFHVQRVRRFEFGTIQTRIMVEKGIIQEIDICKGSLKKGRIVSLENRLTGLRYSNDAIRETLEGLDMESILGPIRPREFTEYLFPFS